MKRTSVLKAAKAIILIIIFAVIAWAAFLHLNWVMLYGIFTAVPGYCLLLFCVTPVGNIRLGSRSERLPGYVWGKRLALAHGVFILFAFVVGVGFLTNGPAFTRGLDYRAGFEAIAAKMVTQWGIFPWGLYGFWGIVIGYLAYVKGMPPYLYGVVRGVCPRWAEPVAKTLVEVTQFSGTSMGIGSVVVGIALILSDLVGRRWGVSAITLPMVSVGGLSFLALGLSSRWVQRIVQGRGDRLAISSVVTWVALSATGILILSAFMGKWVIHQSPIALSELKCRACESYLGASTIVERWEGVYWGWWIVWAPLAGSYIASISRGRTIREIVLGLYGCFAVCGLVGYGIYRGEWWGLWEWGSVREVAMGALALLGWGVLVGVLRGRNRSDFMYSGYMEVPEHFRRTRMWVDEASKNVGLSHYNRSLVGLILGTIMFYLTMGWYGLQIQVVAMAVLIINTIYLAFDFVIIHWLRKSI